MARREVIEVRCDRCGKTETQEPSGTKPSKLELIVEFRGERREYEDLCVRCRRACEGYFKSLTKQVEKEEAEQPAPEPKPEEPKKGLLGLGRKAG